MANNEEQLMQRLRDVAVALHRTTAERDELLSRASEPIAIVGIGCRFPGGSDGPDGYWGLLEAGRDAVGPLEPRWQLVGARPAADAPSWGGLVTDVDRFDAAFFGISPREATTMDPQQRLLLEVAWEAFEDAGIPPSALAGSDTGVFLGATWTDYMQSVLAAGEDARDAYAGTGNFLSVAAGRISYTLGLRGPCACVDTACSSSLVAVHLACQSLRLGECAVALAAGASLLLSADTMTTMARLQAMSPDGRCRSFDAGANGFVRGEGSGAVVLKRLSDALRDGDRIWATIRGSAVNQDGRSNGLTAPNGTAQEALIKRALQVAKVAPEAVGYVETHGTGTPLGDPIEFEALRNVLGAPRPDGSKCVLGAVKTNIGHLEGAAGIAGLIKAALVLAHGHIPTNLNFRTLNPRVRQEGSSLDIARERLPWPRGGADRPRIAGVSSFGISGTNAHAILEEAPPPAESHAAPSRSAELVVLSARSAESLQAGAGKLRDWLDAHPEASPGDVAFSALVTRAPMDRRLPLAVADRGALREALDAAARGEGVAQASPAPDSAPKVAFVFPGQGSQWVGMGRQLLDEEPAFRSALEACDDAIRAEAGWSVIEELRAPAERSRFDRIEVVQPLLFAIEVALASLWRAWGVEPDVVIGHSMGEVAAACVAGALTLADGAAVMCRRAALLARLTGKGEMALVALSMDEALVALEGLEDRLSVAASNGPRSTVLSGDPAALARVLAALEARGVFCRRVKADVAGHSPQLDPLLGELTSQLRSVSPTATSVPMRSTVTGARLAGPELDARYWADNLRQPVRFAQGIQTLIDEGFTLFVEMSPHPVLLTAVEELRVAAGVGGQAIGSLRREQPERLTLLGSLGALFAHGHPLDAKKLFPGGARRLALPTYAWQRQRYWVAGGRTPVLQQLPAQTADGFFRLEWREAAPGANGDARGGRVAVVTVGDDGLAADLAAGLCAAGVACQRVDLESLGSSFDHVVCIWPGHDDAEAAIDAATRALGVAQALASRERPPRLWWVTQQAIAPDVGEVVAPAASAVWGLGRTVAHEHPELRCTLVDLQRGASAAEAMLRELGASDDETQVVWRHGKRRVARLVRAPAADGAPAGETVAPMRTDGTVLVTGGLSGLGLVVATDLARRGVQHLLLLGRRGLETPGASDAVSELESLGVRVTVAAVDVADREALARVIASVGADRPLRAVVHCACVLDDGSLLGQTPERFRKVMAPKVSGAWNLHELTRHAELDAFIVFSSVAGTLGNGGQGPYAAANVFLDSLVCHRRALGLPGTSLAWGPWAERGLAADLDERLKARVVAQGLEMITLSEGRALLAEALDRPEAMLVVAPLDLRAAAKAFGDAVPAVWRDLVEVAPERVTPPEVDWAREIAALPRDRRLEAVTQVVRAEAARVLALGRATAVPADRPLRELGLDSLMAVELRNALGRRARVTLPAKLALDHPTPVALARYLLDSLPEDVARAGELVAPAPAIAAAAHLPAETPPASEARAPVPRRDEIEAIPMGERWLADGFRVIPQPGGFAQLTVDISGVMEALGVLNAAGIRATLPHAMIRAAALALSRNPALHQTVCGYRRMTPGSVDIGLSMAGQTSYAPVVVLPSVEAQPLGVLPGAVEAACARAREKEARDLEAMRKLGWITPFGFFRRFVVRVMQEMFWYRRKLVGTFQVTCVPTVDSAVPLQFYSGSILAFGRPRDAVVVVDGRPEIRPMLTLTVCVDHVAMDGVRAAALLNEIAAVLRSDELVAEARDATLARPAQMTSGIRALLGGRSGEADVPQARSA